MVDGAGKQLDHGSQKHTLFLQIFASKIAKSDVSIVTS
jgi:hypothetical protein